MKFAVEPWAPEYASPFDSDAPGGSSGTVDESAERAVADWTPIRPGPLADEPRTVLFVDGVQRIDAWVWLDGGEEGARPGICASYAAGIVRCDGVATVADCEVGRGLFSKAPPGPIATTHATWQPSASAGETPEHLKQSLQQRMGELEVRLALRAGPADLIVVDGPLSGRQNVPGAIGYVKTHHVRYLSDAAQAVVERLTPGERTPVFVMATSWSRYSWYLRLPGAAAHPWAGIVRCEAAADLSVSQAVGVADRAASVLPRYASAAYKDPRAPQNLYPIAGLERDLRHRLGDQALLYRALRAASAHAW